MEHLREGCQISPYQLMQQTSVMYSQGDLTGQQNPYTTGSYGMPEINPSIMMGSRQDDLSRINGGNMVRSNYSPSMPSDANASHAQAVPHNGALNSQPSSYSHSQANSHMQQPPQAHMGMMPNQGHHIITYELVHSKGSQHAHSTGHSMPQVSSHQSSDGHGSSPPMVPRANHMPRHTIMMRNSSTQTFPSIHMEKEIIKQTLATKEKELEQRGTDSDLQALLDEKAQMCEMVPNGCMVLARQRENQEEKDIIKQTLATKEKELEQRGTDSDLQALLDEKAQMCEMMPNGCMVLARQRENQEEKEIIKQTLATEKKELEQWGTDSNLQALLDEKKEPELIKEEEELSKQQLQSSTLIKKLLAKEKENETTIAAQKIKLDEQTKELERLTTVLDLKEEMQEKHADAMYHVSKEVQRQEKELNMHKSDLENAQEKVRSLQTALDNSYKEIAELQDSASQYSNAQEAVLRAETYVREELEATMEREQQRFRQEQEAFIMQIDDLRFQMGSLEKEHSQREDLLRQEIAHLQERLQQDEAKSQDLTNSEMSVTQPLLRQIEYLQATLGAQSAAWQRVEKNLTDRLAQTALALAQEKERTARNHLMGLSARVASLEAANKQKKAQLAAEVESDRSKLKELQDIRNSAVAQLESSKQRLNKELTQLKMDTQSDMHESGGVSKATEAHEQCPSRPEDLEKPARRLYICFTRGNEMPALFLKNSQL